MNDSVGLNDEVAGSNDVTFEEYKVWLEKYEKNNDGRETNIQNEVVRKFISGICADLDVEDVANKVSASTKHDYLQYCGAYINGKGEEKAHTPDLVISRNWNWWNKVNNVKYCAVVEVKSPFGKQSIFNKENEKYGGKLQKDLNRHLSAKNNDKLILTDGLKWEFYKKIKKTTN
jgi:hypothetical protein